MDGWDLHWPTGRRRNRNSTETYPRRYVARSQPSLSHTPSSRSAPSPHSVPCSTQTATQQRVNAKRQMPNVKSRMPNAKCQMPNAKLNVKCQMPNAKCQMPNAKCQMSNAKCQMPNAKRQMPNAKFLPPHRLMLGHTKFSTAANIWLPQSFQNTIYSRLTMTL